jgi:SIR2-like domain
MTLSKFDWDDLLYAIKDGKCTPFIGAGACVPWLPLGRDIASKWTKDYEYPLEDSYQLSRVAQFLAIKDGSELTPKNLLSREIEELEQKNRPDFSLEKNRNTPHAVLAEFKMPIYITTNYDHLMEHALTDKSKEPVSEFCRWNKFADEAGIESKLKDPKYKPTTAMPVVYHLHGDTKNPSSMVLTENDYIDFIVSLSNRDHEVLPAVIRHTLASNVLLFIGYSLEDITFRIILKSINFPGKRGIAILRTPERYKLDLDKFQAYLEQYTNELFKIRVYWGDAYKFSEELRKRWDDFNSTG